MKRATNLGEAMRLYRAVNDRTLRDIAPEIGIGHATLMRIEHGEAMDADTLLKLWQWLLKSPRAEGGETR